MKYQVDLYYPNESISRIEIEAESAQLAADEAISDNPAAFMAKTRQEDATETSWAASVRSAEYDSRLQQYQNDEINALAWLGVSVKGW